MSENILIALGMQTKKLIEKNSKYLSEKYNLRPVELSILTLLVDREHNTAKDIKEIKHFSKAHISKSIENLKQGNFITLREDVNDHRVIHIDLNPAAYEIIEEVKRIYENCRKVMFRNIPQEKIDIMKLVIT